MFSDTPADVFPGAGVPTLLYKAIIPPVETAFWSPTNGNIIKIFDGTDSFGIAETLFRKLGLVS